MKKTLFIAVIAAGFFIACQDEAKDNQATLQEVAVDMSDFYVKTDEVASKGEKGEACYSMKVLNMQLDENPGLYKKMYDVEFASRKFLNSKKPDGSPGGGGNGGGDDGDIDVLPVDDGLGIINIPVYVHIVLPNASDVSNQQVQSQMNVINDDFSSPNTNQLPNDATDFVNDATNSEISFSLAGTFRYNDPTSSWGTRDVVKQAYPPVTPETHLNIWVCNIGGGILGYAQFPGGNLNTDGVVLLYSSLPGGSAAPYNEGRTLTHEIGHYLNLRHIWGDGRCRQDDFVTDTPASDGPNYGCPTYPTVNCKSADMTMNYMDYVDDACMYMFTDGQRNRMRAIFQPGGPRASILN